jgi:TonB family protein
VATYDDNTQRIEGSLTSSAFVSGLLHAVILGLIFFGARLFPGLSLGGTHPGGAGAGAIQANLVSGLPGGSIPMPSPTDADTRNRLANENPGTGVTVPQHAPTPARDAIALPSRRKSPLDLAQLQAERQLDQLVRSDAKNADQRIAYGQGGPASFSYSMSGEGVGGGGGMAFGDAAFGSMYADYVNRLRDRLSYYWSREYRDPSLPAGRLVFVTFTVTRNGEITGVDFAQRSNVPELDSRALHAVQLMASSERLPLPAGYPKSTLDVRVSFELQ